MNALQKWLKAHPYKGPFKPLPHYNQEGNMITAYFKDEDCYTETLEGSNNLVEVCRSMKTDEIVGVKIHGIRQLVHMPREEKP